MESTERRNEIMTILSERTTPISASALARYPGPRVIGALKKALRSSNWYVRYAAAASLEALHIDDTDLIEIVTGSDRYAREILLYRMKAKRLEQEAREQTAPDGNGAQGEEATVGV